MVFENIKNKASYNVALVALFQGLTGILAVITNIIIARVLGKEQFGEYSFYFGILSLIILIPIFGCSDFNAKYPSKENLKIGAKYSLAISIVVCLMIGFVAYLSNRQYLFYLIPYLFIYPFFSLINNSFRGIKKFLLMNVFILIRYTLYLLLIILIISKVKENGILIVVMAIPPLILIPFLYRYIKELPNKSTQTTDIKQVFFLFLVAVNINVFFYLDKVLLGIQFSFSDIGTYTAYSNILNIMRLISGAISVVIIPLAMSSKFNTSESIKRLISILLPIGILLSVASYYIVPTFYGQTFKIDSMLLPLFIGISVILLNIYTFVNSVFVAENKYNFKFIILELIFSIILLPTLFIASSKILGLYAMPIATSIVLLIKSIVNLHYIKINRNKGAMTNDWQGSSV